MDLHKAEEVMCIRGAACGLVALSGTKIDASKVSYIVSSDRGGLLVIYSEPDQRRGRESGYSHEVHIWECGEKVLSMRWHEEIGQHMVDLYDSGPWGDSLMAKALNSITLN